MPTTMCTAAVEHQAWRGNGAMFVSGNNVAPQLKNATMKNCYCTDETSRAARITTATTNPSQLAAPHCLSRVRSLLRLRGAAERPGRQRRLRAHTRQRSRMPITRPVNSRGVQSARNILISGIDQIDMERAIPRRVRRTLRRKVGILPQEDTRQRRPLGSITRLTPRRATRPGHELRMSYTFLGLPQLLFCSEKNWFLIRRHVETGSNLIGTGITGATFTRVRLGTAIASSYTRHLTASGTRVRRLAHRSNAPSGRPNQSEPQRPITWLAHAVIISAIQVAVSVAASADRHAFWTTGGRASGTPGSPAATLSADTPGRLQRYSASDFTGFWLIPYLDYHVCWITGERASDTPGLPAASRTSDTAGRLQRFSACSITGAHCTSDLGRQACSNFTANRPTFYLELSACWTTGERASDTPGSPVASFFIDTLGRPQHLLDCCFFSACRMFYWDRNAWWTIDGRASDTSGSLLVSLSPGTCGRPQSFLHCTSAYPQHDCCIVEVVAASTLLPPYVTPLIYFEVVTSSPLVARPQHTTVSAEVLAATRKVMPAHSFTVFQQGLAAVSEATVLLPLMRLPAHFPPFDDSARQSVGIDGDDDT